MASQVGCLPSNAPADDQSPVEEASGKPLVLRGPQLSRVPLPVSLKRQLTLTIPETLPDQPPLTMTSSSTKEASMINSLEKADGANKDVQTSPFMRGSPQIKHGEAAKRESQPAKVPKKQWNSPGLSSPDNLSCLICSFTAVDSLDFGAHLCSELHKQTKLNRTARLVAEQAAHTAAKQAGREAELVKLKD